MIADLRNTFRVSFIMRETPTPIASAAELLTEVQSQDPALEWIRIDAFPRETVWKSPGKGEKPGNVRIRARSDGMTLKAIFDNGMFRPREPIHLEEHTQVEVVMPATAPSDADDPTGWKATEALSGFIDAPADTAEHHDDEYVGARP